MKGLFFVLAFLGFVSCTKLSFQNEDTLKSRASSCSERNINDYDYFGELHNDALMNVYSNFNDTAHLTLNSFINSINEFNNNYINDSFPLILPSAEFDSYMFRFKGFVVTNYLIDTLSNGASTFNYKLDDLNSLGLISLNEKTLLLRLFNTVNLSLAGNLNGQELSDSVSFYTTYWKKQNFCENQKFRQLSGVILNIAQHSILYWNINSLHVNFNSNELQTRFLPPWAAADIGGALWGSTAAALLSGGDPSWESLGKGALSGAIGSSTGIVGKIGKGIGRFFK